MKGFSVIYRNYGHWDICTNEGRAFRIRGTPGAFKVLDERAAPYPSYTFKTMPVCMAFVAEQLMHEDIEAEPIGTGNNQPIKRP